MGKIAFVAKGVASDEAVEANRRYARGLGLPEIGQIGPSRVPLAVVGGGHSIPDFISELRGWDGEVWAINGTYAWCAEHGIPATFYSIDPMPGIADLIKGASSAVLADTVCPEAFKECPNVTLARTGLDATPHDSSSASTAPMIAAEGGYTSVTFFGCEGSFPPNGTTHAYKDVPMSRVLVRCGGVEYMTDPGFLMQTEFLAGLARGVTGWIRAKGGGLLGALIEHGDYDVVAVSRNISDALGGNDGEPC